MQTKEVQNDVGAMEGLKKAIQDVESHSALHNEVTSVNTEQWKDGGNCDICRRQTYCGTPCKAKKVRVAKEIQAERDALIQEMIMDMMKDAKEVEEIGEEGTAADERAEA